MDRRLWLAGAWVCALACGAGAQEVVPGQSGSVSDTEAGSTSAASGSAATTVTETESGSATAGTITSTSATTTASGTESTTQPTGETTDGETSGTTGGEVCTLPVLIHDPFDDTDFAVGGAGAVNGGMNYDDNNVNDGTIVEADGAVSITTPVVSGGAAPNVGVRTVASFDGTTTAGVTAVAVIQATDQPIWQGVVLSIHSNPSFYELSGAPSMELHAYANPATGGDGNVETVSLWGDAGDDHQYTSVAYDADAITDGFTAVLTAEPGGWSFRVEGLLQNGNPITQSGNWEPGFGYGDLLDAESWVSVAIQGATADETGRTLVVQSVTLFDGTCADNVVPSLP